MLPPQFLSVVIPVYHDWDKLCACVDALNDQTLDQKYFEILIVNNEPDDLASTGIRSQKNLILLHEPLPGPYAARNKGIAAAKGSILVFTDADCIPGPTWLENIYREFERDAGLARIAGKVDIFKEKGTNELVYLYEKEFAFVQETFSKKFGAAVTANMASRKLVFDEVGVFDGHAFCFEDIEWGMRALKHGYDIKYSDKIIVRHPARKNMRQLIRKHKRVVGGIYFHQVKKKTIFARILYAMKLTIPPVSLLIKKYHTPGINRLNCFMLRWRINIGKLEEFLQLSLFDGKMKR